MKDHYEKVQKTLSQLTNSANQLKKEMQQLKSHCSDEARSEVSQKEFEKIDTSIDVATFQAPCIDEYGEINRLAIEPIGDSFVLQIDTGHDPKTIVRLDVGSVTRLYQFVASRTRIIKRDSLGATADADYPEYMQKAQNTGVVISHTGELGTYCPRFVVAPVEDQTYWLESFVLEDDAYAFCNNNGLAVHRQECTIEKCKYCELAKKERSRGEQTRQFC